MGARLSSRGYASVMHTVREEPMTAAAVGQALGVAVGTMRMVLRRMAALRLVYVAAWSEPSIHVVPSPMYRMGAQDGVPPPPHYSGRPSRHQAAVGPATLKPRSEMVAFSVMVGLLKTHPRTRQDLVDASGVNKDAVSRLLRHMKAMRLVRITGWRHGPCGPASACYSFGDGLDVPKPQPTRRKVNAWRLAAVNASVFHQAANA